MPKGKLCMENKIKSLGLALLALSAASMSSPRRKRNRVCPKRGLNARHVMPIGIFNRGGRDREFLRVCLAVALSCFAACLAPAAVYEHAVYDSVPLDGAWEMAYQPYEWGSPSLPDFSGVRVENAVPGYWEDMVGAFRTAGMTCDFRINPQYAPQTLPVSGQAGDIQLPNIYGCFFYRRTFSLREVRPAVLAFEGVRNQVHVWINGSFAGFRAGFSTPFEIEIPGDMLRTGENEVVLAVSNNPNLGYCGAYVCGLTTRAVFGSTGGVNGRLELRFPRNGLGDVYVTTAKDLKSFTVHAGGADNFLYEIRDGGRLLAKGRAKGDFNVSTDGFEFWSPENPRRYELVIETTEGAYRQLFGIRRLVTDGERLLLNGRPVYMRGVTEHCYFPKTVHLPRDLEYYRMIARKRKELGFNFVRFHTFVPPVEYLEATDELGLLVHVETPNFVAEPEFGAIVAFARRHPSVVIYCMGNEWRIDRLSETYLEDCAGIVHANTDSLFSPMSALRGCEYALVPGKDVIADHPFSHNPERLSRMSRYCDLFTSYQLGVTSYSSLNYGTSALLDAWGDAYCGKPRLSHEICIDGSYADLSLEALYPKDSPILRTGLFSEIRRQLDRKGLIGRADVYFRNSCEWMWRIRKHCFEKIRAAKRVAGYDFLGDINTHWHTFGYSVGMMDEFYRLKPGETVENVLRYNSAAVLLSDLGSDFNVESGARKRVAMSVSNYADDAKDATLSVSLASCPEGDCPGAAAQGRSVVWRGEKRIGDVALGELATLGEFDIEVPKSKMPRKYVLRAKFSSKAVSAENEWELYAFPRSSTPPLTHTSTPPRVVETITSDELLAAMERGERVLLLGAGPFRSQPMTYRIGMAGRCTGNFATVVKKGHPALEGLPHGGYCGWQFRRLMEGGRAVQLEADIPFDPVVDVASAVKFVIRQAAMFEYRVGPGRLLVCSFNFKGSDPAVAWLRERLVAYAGSSAFEPAQSIAPEQLRAVMDAPLLRGDIDTNRARNLNDPSSAVRAGKFAQP